VASVVLKLAVESRRMTEEDIEIISSAAFFIFDEKDQRRKARNSIARPT
jgi:hypothetical protein